MPAIAIISSEAQVANLALGLTGSRQPIDRLDEASTEAQLANTYFASTRDELLQRWAWRFATRRQTLALQTETRSEWAYCYALPTDYVPEAFLRIYNGVREPGVGDLIPFAIEANDAGDGLLICTDQPSAVLIYVFRQSIVARWPPLFTKAMAARLAVYLAAALPVKPELALQLERRAELAFQTAAAASGNAVVRDAEADAESIRAR